MATKKQEEEMELDEKTSSKMSKAQAEAIVNKYDGINGVPPTEELTKAREVLSASK